jgi:hypothetical protein
MVVLIALVVVVAVVVGVYLQQRGRPAGGERGRAVGGVPSGASPGPGKSARAPLGPGSGALAADLSRWVGADLISADQAEAITGFERAAFAGRGAAGGERRVSLLAEALGYVGVVLALAGAAVGLAQGWENLPVWARLTIPAAATGLLVLGGILLRRQEEPAFRRLLSVLWMLAVGGAAWTLVVLGIDVTDLDAAPIALMVAGGCTILAGVLFLARRHGLQQVALLASLHALVISGLVCLPGDRPPAWWFATAVWALGAVWAALGWRNIVEPGWLAVAFGFVGMVVGPAIGLGDYEWLLAPALATTAFLVALSVPTRQTPLLALGTLGAFGYITWAVVHYFKDSLGVPLALVIVGAVFLILAVLAGALATRGRGKAPAPTG